MGETTGQSEKTCKCALIKALTFLTCLIAFICLVRFIPVKDYLSAETQGNFLESWGFWAPTVFVFLYALSLCLFVPGSFLPVLGAAIFGAYWGFLYAWLGAMTAAGSSFFIGRTLGRDFVASLMGNRLRKYDEAIRRKGFATVLYLRLIYFPFALLNYGMGLTRIKFRDYFFGTGLGIVAGLFVLTFFGGVLKDAWTSGNWEALKSSRAFLSLALFLLSFSIPLFIRKIKGAPWLR